MNCRPPRQIGIAVGLVSAVVLAIPPSTRAQGSGVQAFTGATLIDGNGARIDKAVLVIRDGRVVSAGRSGAVPVPKEARQIPLAGKFVIPGLMIGGGIAYSLDKMDVFFSYFQLLQGNDSHGGHAITAGVSWPFEIRW